MEYLRPYLKKKKKIKKGAVGEMEEGKKSGGEGMKQKDGEGGTKKKKYHDN